MKKKITDKDRKVWEKFLSRKDKLPNKDLLSEDSFSYNSVTLDLHGYTLRDANIAIKNLINNSYNKGIKKMTIITGKGMRSKNYDDPFKSKKLSILKYSVPEFIKNDNDLMKRIKKINIEEIEDLNSGSFTIHLKVKNENKY